MVELIRNVLNNIGLLLLLIAIYDLLNTFNAQHHNNIKKILSIGLAIGVISCSLYSFQWGVGSQPLLSFRGVLFCLSTIFFGFASSVIGFIIQLSYQYLFGYVSSIDLVEVLSSIFIGEIARFYILNHSRHYDLYNLTWKPFLLIGLSNILFIILLLYLLNISAAASLFANENSEFIIFPMTFTISTILVGLQLTRFFQRNYLKDIVQEKDELFHAIFDSQSVGIAITVVKQKQYEVNYCYCTLLGYNESEITQYAWGDLTHPDDFKEEIDIYEQLMCGKIDHYSMEKRVFRKDGQMIYTQANLMRFQGKDLKPLLMICSADITLFKKMKLKEQRRQHQLEFIIKVANIGIWHWELSKGQMLRNVQSQGLLSTLEHSNHHKKSFLGKPIEWFNQIFHEDKEKVMQALQRYFDGVTELFFCEYRIQSSHGKERYVREYALFLNFDEYGNPLEMVGAQIDITEEKKVERKWSAIKDLTELSHYSINKKVHSLADKIRDGVINAV